MRVKSLVLSALVLVVAIQGLIVGTSSAHAPSGFWYPERWKRDLSVNWAFTSGFPTGTWRDRVWDAVGQWNGLNQSMSWVKVANYNDFNPFSCPGTYQKNGVHWRDLSGAYAEEHSCIFSGTNEMYSTQIVFDSVGHEWYTGTGDAPDGFANLCPTSCAIDAWSIATHEFGHGTGFSPNNVHEGHFDPNESPTCDDGELQNSVCRYYTPGSERWRTPASHDSHTFGDTY